ncbi:MAG TPA: SH3 domain-containing C40 family peptidase [Pseudoflavonifractor sp.]|jgi:cell wall-associated NlpC family hydrolase|nr:SH3 domain-containing C40 family peptidase [Pseudoflavonifractor sp.]
MILSAKALRVAVLGTVLSSLFVVGAAASSVGVGTTTDKLRLRETASTDSTTLATAEKGDTVIVLEDAGSGWYKVDYKTVVGFMSGEFLTIQTQADVTIGYGMVQTDGAALNVRSGAGTDFEKVAALNNGAVVDIVGVNNGWYKVSFSGGTGYVSSDYMITVKDSAGSRGDGTVAAAATSLGQQIVDYAKNFLGVKYVWGGNGPNSFDCSGFTKYVYAHFGYILNRTATDQLSNGTRVSSSGELQVGDLVFFNNGNTSKPVSHVGIYIGGGQFIHASTNAYRVQTDNLFSGYYSRVYVGGRHVV